MTAPTQSLSSTLARDWILEVLIGSDWTRVRGLTSVSPIFEGALQDDSDIDSEGYASEIATGLSYRIEGGGKRKGENTAASLTIRARTTCVSSAARPDSRTR